MVRGSDGSWQPTGRTIEPTGTAPDGSPHTASHEPRLARDGTSLWLRWIDTDDTTSAAGTIRAARVE
jgi:hypothetical protein